MSRTGIFLTGSEWSLWNNNPKPPAIKFSCLSLCEAEGSRGKKGFFVFLGGRKEEGQQIMFVLSAREGRWPNGMIAFQPACSWEVCSRSVWGHWEQGVRKDKSGPKEALLDGLKVTVPLQDHHVCRDLILVSFPEHFWLSCLPGQEQVYVSITGGRAQFSGLWLGSHCPVALRAHLGACSNPQESELWSSALALRWMTSFTWHV